MGLWIAESEGAHFWLSVLNDLKARGVEDILIACVDGLTGFPDAIESAFPNTDLQLCIVHQIRASLKYVPWKDRKQFCSDLRAIYGAATLEAAQHARDAMEESWGKRYPAAVRPWRDKWDLLTTFFRYPLELRKMIYTTNAIEALHRQLRKNSKNRGVFPNDEALLKLLFLNIKNITKKWTRRRNWSMVMNQLTILFPDRLSQE